jgi:hypothetical protein
VRTGAQFQKGQLTTELGSSRCFSPVHLVPASVEHPSIPTDLPQEPPREELGFLPRIGVETSAHRVKPHQVIPLRTEWALS